MTSPAMSKTMKAVRIPQFGGPEVLRLESVPIPTPAAGELLIKVAAAGVNPVDYKIRSGKYPAVKQDKLPFALGRDIAGTVVECGPATSRFAKGDSVFAMPGMGRGGYAEYAVVKVSEAAPKPETLDVMQAGAVPLAALTAWQGLFKHGKLEAGQRVLIHGGSGGVGHFAIQFAKAKDAHVITTVSAANIDFVRRLGADEVIDYQAQRFEDVVDEVDVVFDLVGGDIQQRSWQVLKKGGVLVSTLNEPSQDQAAARGARGLRYTVTESGADLAEIGVLIDAGRVKPVITRTYQLKDAAAAERFLEQEHPAGKVVLSVP
ncbi:MAG TPA: NADP-dependent oxidoreductase [Steroidobacteraceae bacterium]|jgi:NADPH:quinone reductase-like Zn-dependent oxidoreductase|nr:NADP-dependent oxidoreductase [Steroidobacteraceae bacterium]